MPFKRLLPLESKVGVCAASGHAPATQRPIAAIISVNFVNRFIGLCLVYARECLEVPRNFNGIFVLPLKKVFVSV